MFVTDLYKQIVQGPAILVRKRVGDIPRFVGPAARLQQFLANFHETLSCEAPGVLRVHEKCHMAKVEHVMQLHGDLEELQFHYDSPLCE